MSPRTPSLFLAGIALVTLLPAAPARAAAADPATSPLVRALLARRPGALPGTVTQATPAPLTLGADPFHALPTALGPLRATATRPGIVAGAPFRAPSPYGPPPAGKLPGVQGIGGDLFGSSLGTLGDMYGDGVSDVVIGAPAAVGPGGQTGEVAVYYESPGVMAPPSFLYGEQVFSYFGQSVAGVGDVNGDGYPDLLVGAPYFDVGGNTDAGKAYLFLGGPFGLQPVPAWTFQTGNPGDNVGYSVAWAGDVNNDGYDDWLVGAPGASSVYLFKGGPASLSTTPTWSFTGLPGTATGYSVSTAGDVNGDGYADILVGAPAFSGSFGDEGKVSLFFGHALKPSVAADDSFLGGQANAFLGQAVSTAGDVNGDGYADFMMGAPGYDDGLVNRGEVLIQAGGPFAPLFVSPEQLEGGVANANFGASVATAGDVNGDGYADVIVGATGVLNGTNQGAAYVYVGSQFGTINEIYDVITSLIPGELLGGAVATIGDINGDGFSDYIAGSLAYPNGDAWNHFGAAFTPGFTEAVAAQGYDANTYTGSAVAAADVNGDGYDDLIVGSYQKGTTDPSDGQASIYFGGPRPFPSVGSFPFLGAAPDWTIEGDYLDLLGYSVANAGDVNGDGYQDFLVGAPLHTNPAQFQGAAELFYGSPSGPGGGTPWVSEGSQAGDLAGFAVTGDGDLNGDGYDDVVVGVPQADNDQGAARVYYGSGFGLAHTPVITLHGHQASAFLGIGAAIVGDINGDGYDDLVVGAMGDSVTLHGEGIAYVYDGGPTGIHAAPDDSIPGGALDGEFGWAVSRIGDVNGDGYDDVAIAAPTVSDTYSQQGRISVYLGSPSGLQKPAAWELEGGSVNENLGQHGVSGGDVNADGYADLVVGDPFGDINAPDGGSVFVFSGGPAGLGVSTIFQEHSGGNSWNMGFATLGRADFDGDGFPDLVYTAPGATMLNPAEGATFVRFGNCIWFNQRNPDRPLAAWRADDSAPVSPGLRSDATNAFRLHGRGRSAAGRTRLRLESEVKPGSTAFDFAGHTFSGWQATAAIAPGAGSSTLFDRSLSGFSPGARYRWRARWQSRNLFFPYTPWFGTEQRNPSERHVVMAGGAGPVAVDPLPGGGAVELAAAQPNPSTAEASLSFTLPREGAARLALYDLRGALVRTLFEGPARAGQNRVSWDGRDATGRVAPAGAYFVRLSALGEEKTGKLVHIE